MKPQSKLFPSVKLLHTLPWLRRHWLATFVAIIATIALLRGMPAWAASGPIELRQTVPPPTEAPTDTPIPPATDTPAPPPPPPPDTPAPPPPDTGNPQPPPDNNPSAQPTDTPPAPAPAPAGGGSGSGSSGGGNAGNVSNGNRLWGDVIVNSLNMRRGPGTNYPSLGALKRAEVIEVLARNQANNWWKVCCITNTVTSGWVSAQFIAPRFAISQSLQLIPIATDIPAPPAVAITPTVSSTVTPTVSAAITPAVSTAPVTTTVRAGQAAAPAVVPTVAPTVAPTVVPTPTKPVQASYAIQLQMSLTPTYPLQGEQVTLVLVVSNPGNQTANNVELRDELPLGLTYVSATVDNGATITRSTTTGGRDVFSVIWPTLPARSTVTALVVVQVDANLPDGLVLDNLAYAGAPNFPGTTAGVSIGTPPVALPGFQ